MLRVVYDCVIRGENLLCTYAMFFEKILYSLVCTIDGKKVDRPKRRRRRALSCFNSDKFSVPANRSRDSNYFVTRVGDSVTRAFLNSDNFVTIE